MSVCQKRKDQQEWSSGKLPTGRKRESRVASSLLVAHAAHTPRRGIVSAQQGMMRWEVGGAVERGT